MYVYDVMGFMFNAKICWQNLYFGRCCCCNLCLVWIFTSSVFYIKMHIFEKEKWCIYKIL